MMVCADEPWSCFGQELTFGRCGCVLMPVQHSLVLEVRLTITAAAAAHSPVPTAIAALTRSRGRIA